MNFLQANMSNSSILPKKNGDESTSNDKDIPTDSIYKECSEV